MTPLHRLVVAIASLLVSAGCGPSEEQAAFEASTIALDRRIRGLTELVAEAEKGSLIPTDRFFVGVDEKLVADLFRSQLPLEQPLEDRFVVRLERADMRFREKYGAVHIEGSIHPKALPSRSVALRIDGGLGAAEIDPETGILRVAIAIDHIEVAKAAGLEGILGGGVIRYLGSKGREILQDAIPAIEVPVTLSQSVPVPAVEEKGVRLGALEVPLDVSVESVMAAAGKLWVSFDARVGEVKGSEGGLGVDIDKTKKPDAKVPGV